MARFSWDKQWTPSRHYFAYAHTQASGDRVSQLAEILTTADKNKSLLATGTPEIKDGHVVTHEYTGDYNEAFTFWNNYEPDPAVIDSQKSVAAALRSLVNAALTPVERERLAYLSGHVEFAVPYTEAWMLAHRLNALLQKADADQLRREGIPIWLKLAPQVRKSVIAFQRIVATRNDLGTLASIQNKLVRLALVRLPMSLEEKLGELPAEVDAAYRAAIEPDSTQPERLIVPTRPTMLAAGETVRLLAIVPGPDQPTRVSLHTRISGAAAWTPKPAKLLGRRTYEMTLGPFQPGAASLAEYYISAEAGAARFTVPFAGVYGPYRLTFMT